MDALIALTLVNFLGLFLYVFEGLFNSKEKNSPLVRRKCTAWVEQFQKNVQ